MVPSRWGQVRAAKDNPLTKTSLTNPPDPQRRRPIRAPTIKRLLHHYVNGTARPPPNQPNILSIPTGVRAGGILSACQLSSLFLRHSPLAHFAASTMRRQASGREELPCGIDRRAAWPVWRGASEREAMYHRWSDRPHESFIKSTCYFCSKPHLGSSRRRT